LLRKRRKNLGVHFFLPHPVVRATRGSKWTISCSIPEPFVRMHEGNKTTVVIALLQRDIGQHRLQVALVGYKS